MDASDLLKDLELDLVLSQGQVQRHYGLLLDDLNLPHVGRVEVALPVPGRGTEAVSFLVHPLVAHWTFSSQALRHLAGLAEARRVLGARKGWKVLPPKGFASPDALWDEVVVEYDVDYPSPILKRKLARYEAYPAQIWATETPARMERIRLAALEMGIQNLRQVLVAPWF